MSITLRSLREDVTGKFNPASQRTQRGNTNGGRITDSIKRAIANHPDHRPIKTGLEVGAGLGHVAKDVGGRIDARIKTQEPHPQKGFKPDHEGYDIPKGHDVVYTNHVHNVVHPDVRDHITRGMLHSVKTGGSVHIFARSDRDVMGAKGGTAGEEENSKVFDNGVYQKGFKKGELSDHLKRLTDEHAKIHGSKWSVGEKDGVAYAIAHNKGTDTDADKITHDHEGIKEEVTEGLRHKIIGAAALMGTLAAAMPGDKAGYEASRDKVYKKMEQLEKERKEHRTVTLKDLKAPVKKN